MYFNGCRVGRGFFFNFIIFGMWFSGGLFVRNFYVFLEKMGELVSMDGVDDIEYFGFSEDLGKEGKVSVFWFLFLFLV